MLRANRKMRELEVGGLLTVRATDPAAEQDFPAYCRQTGHELVSAGRDGDVLVFDPTRVTDGIELTGDPILRVRTAAYRASVGRRTQIPASAH